MAVPVLSCAAIGLLEVGEALSVDTVGELLGTTVASFGSLARMFM